MLKLILEKGADPAREEPDGSTPLHHAAANPEGAVLSQLLKHQPELYTRDDNDQTAVAQAAEGGLIENVRQLEQAGANLNDHIVINAVIGNDGDVRGAVALAEAQPGAPVVSNAAMRALSLIGDGAGALAFLRRLPETAIDRGTYLLAMRAHKTDADGCLALFRACEPATGEPVDEKLVAAALEALAEARLSEDAAELARDAARRGIGLDDRGGAALVRAFRRSGDWQGALEIFGDNSHLAATRPAALAEQLRAPVLYLHNGLAGDPHRAFMTAMERANAPLTAREMTLTRPATAEAMLTFVENQIGAGRLITSTEATEPQ